MIPLTWGTYNMLLETENRMVISITWGEGDLRRGGNGELFSGIKSPYLTWISSRNPLYNTVPTVNNVVWYT